MKNIRNKKVERAGLILTLLFLANAALWLYMDYIKSDEAFAHFLVFGSTSLIICISYLIFYIYTYYRRRLSPNNNHFLLIYFIIFTIVFFVLWARTGFISF